MLKIYHDMSEEILEKIISTLKDYEKTRKEGPKYKGGFVAGVFGKPSKTEKISAVNTYLNFIIVGDLSPDIQDIQNLQQGSLGRRILPLLAKLGFGSVSDSIEESPNIRDLYGIFCTQEEDYERTISKEDVRSQIYRNSLLVNKVKLGQSRLDTSIDMKKHSRRQSLSNPTLPSFEKGNSCIMLQEDYFRAQRKSLTIDKTGDLSTFYNKIHHRHQSREHIFTGLEFEIACISKYAQNSPAEFYEPHTIVAVFGSEDDFFQEVLETDNSHALEYVTSPRYIKKDNYLERALYIAVLVYIWVDKEIFGYNSRNQPHHVWYEKHARDNIDVDEFTNHMAKFFNKKPIYNNIVINKQALKSVVKPINKFYKGVNFQFNLSGDTIPVNIKEMLFTETKRYYPEVLESLQKIFPRLDEYVLLGMITYIRQIPIMILEVIHSESTATEYKYRNHIRALNFLAYYFRVEESEYSSGKLRSWHKKMVSNPGKYISEENSQKKFKDFSGKKYKFVFSKKNKYNKSIFSGNQLPLTLLYASRIKDYNYFWLKCSLPEFLKHNCKLPSIQYELENFKAVARDIILNTSAYRAVSKFYQYSKEVALPKCSILKSELETIINNMIELLINDIDTFARFDKNKYYSKELGQLKKINEYKTIGARQDTYIKSDNIVIESRNGDMIYKSKSELWFHNLMDKVSRLGCPTLNTYDEIIDYVNGLDSGSISVFKELI